MKNEIKQIKEVLGALIIMLTLNSNGTLIPRDSCYQLLKIVQGKKWTKKYEKAIQELEK